ncbi:phytoene desaturase family protein [Mucilaginibacter gotjawali]|uniref:Phytoene desaturase n=2 Tax=Mucilaginibacter gotjawali TaxID=1550579 RepID=A0A839SPM9_9SPHI|nr:phytoene desaturase family protein [Mucilaginibacter gotjawali]MBB3058439.1 phytoene desaturase [Mucilaginibacter gotjawali]BAU53732.1 zeta-carotene-forming phytoene desaturase [Mucilaginibacter gotjawali]
MSKRLVSNPGLPVVEKPSVAVIGSGFSGLSAAAYLAKAGCSVNIYEKNAETGGRARQLISNGYTFDMGPSWYWMPEVFENFFNEFGYSAADYYELEQLDPGFTIVFGDQDVLRIPANYQALEELFESIEPGSAKQLALFLDEAAYKYHTGMNKLVQQPGLSLLEFADWDLVRGVFKLQVFTSFSKHVRRFFKDQRLITLMEFPVLFLGAMPEETPALYSLMNYAGLKLGTWYPKGGFGKVIEGMQKVCEAQGVIFNHDSAVTRLNVVNGKVTALNTKGSTTNYEGVIAAADYHHVEEKLIDRGLRNYGEAYWNKRVMAPSSLIFYLGVTRKIEKLGHHTLFFDADLKVHAREIYKEPQWPTKPLFYVCCPSASDDSVAPAGHENLFILMPLAPGIEDTEALREEYFEMIMQRLENYTGVAIRTVLDYKKSYCVNDFKSDYNSFKGNAYGLANTLMQTAHLKPSIKNNKIRNLFYAGQLTVPGPGVPPSIISGKVSAQLLIKYLNTK